VPLVSLEQGGAESFTVRKAWLSVWRAGVLEADLIISVTKVKTHVLTGGFTCGVKNMYGDARSHEDRNAQALLQPPRFGRLLAALYGKVKPALSVADGIVGMEGNGPTAGNLVRLGFLAASADPWLALGMPCICQLAWDLCDGRRRP